MKLKNQRSGPKGAVKPGKKIQIRRKVAMISKERR
jgi:hypothetical protein